MDSHLGNNNSKLQNLYKKSKENQNKSHCEIYCSKGLHLRSGRVLRSVSTELHRYNNILAFTTNKPTRKTRHRGRLQWAVGVKDPGNRHKVGRIEEGVKYNPKKV